AAQGAPRGGGLVARPKKYTVKSYRGDLQRKHPDYILNYALSLRHLQYTFSVEQVQAITMNMKSATT
ncbi:hypothetical protein BX616_009517, partial [Lobosporangium transversale]